MPMCRSPPFLSKNADKKRNGGNKWKEIREEVYMEENLL